MKVVNVTKKIKERVLFSSFNYEFNSKGFYFIVGESGSGKSTLLNMLSGIDNNYEGDINYLSYSLRDKNNINYLRKNYFSYVFQSFNLFENDTVINNLLLMFDNKNKESKEEKNKEVDMILSFLDIKNLKYKIVKDLSGGEKQRVCIARALLNNPNVIFADEPTGSLDSKNSDNIFKLFKEISKEKLVICVTHDVESAKIYSDVILEIKDKKIKEIKKNKNIKDRKNNNLKKAKNRNISFYFIISHFKNLMRTKKVRYMISNIFFTFSLMILGISILVKDNISSSLNDSFKTLLGNQSVVLKRKDENTAISDYMCATYDEVKEIKDDYSEDIKDIGVNYLVDFESYFKDHNTLYNVSKTPIKEIENFSIRNFNEFYYVDSFKNIETYTNIDKLKDDEIVLGINYPQLKNICLSFQIERSYESLGKYIENNNFLVGLYLKNENWNYSDEQIFKVKGIVADSKSRIYHSNILFNERLFEDSMRFPSSLDIKKDEDLPWIMKKCYYVKTKEFQNGFLNKIMYDNKYKEYLFDNDSISYSPLTYENKELSDNKLYVYSLMHNPIDLNIVSSLKNNLKDLSSFYYSSSGGYLNYGNNLFSGFANSVFLNNDEEKLVTFLDSYLKLSNEEKESIAIDDSIAYGNAYNLTGENLRFTTLKESKIKGNDPTNIYEIGISSSLANKINVTIDDKINVALTSYKNDSKYISNGFKIIKLKVVGIYKNDNLFIYQDSDFSISLFRDLFKISSFDLIINSIVFEDNSNFSKEEINKLNNMFYEYKFENILNDLEENIKETLSVLEIILMVFSFITMVFSVIILIIINSINMEENKEEMNIFHLLGYENKEIFKVYISDNIFLLILAIISSIIGVVLSQLMINFVLNKQLKTIISFSFPFGSILAILLASLLIISLIIPFIFHLIKTNESCKEN